MSARWQSDETDQKAKAQEKVNQILNAETYPSEYTEPLFVYKDDYDMIHKLMSDINKLFINNILIFVERCKVFYRGNHHIYFASSISQIGTVFDNMQSIPYVKVGKIFALMYDAEQILSMKLDSGQDIMVLSSFIETNANPSLFAIFHQDKDAIISMCKTIAKNALDNLLLCRDDRGTSFTYPYSFSDPPLQARFASTLSNSSSFKDSSFDTLERNDDDRLSVDNLHTWLLRSIAFVHVKYGDGAYFDLPQCVETILGNQQYKHTYFSDLVEMLKLSKWLIEAKDQFRFFDTHLINFIFLESGQQRWGANPAFLRKFAMDRDQISIYISKLLERTLRSRLNAEVSHSSSRKRRIDDQTFKNIYNGKEPTVITKETKMDPSPQDDAASSSSISIIDSPFLEGGANAKKQQLKKLENEKLQLQKQEEETLRQIAIENEKLASNHRELMELRALMDSDDYEGKKLFLQMSKKQTAAPAATEAAKAAEASSSSSSSSSEEEEDEESAASKPKKVLTLKSKKNSETQRYILPVERIQNEREKYVCTKIGDLIKSLDKFGVAIWPRENEHIPEEDKKGSLLSEKSLNENTVSIWQDLEKHIVGLRRTETRSWIHLNKKSNYDALEGNLLPDYGFGWFQGAQNIRQKKQVSAVFSKLLQFIFVKSSPPPLESLYASVEGISAYLNLSTYGRGYSDPQMPLLHTYRKLDRLKWQTSKRYKTVYPIQGMVNMMDPTWPKDVPGPGLLFLEGSHKKIDEFLIFRNKYSDTRKYGFCPLENKEEFNFFAKEHKCALKLIRAEKGDLVLWTSNLVHSKFIPTKPTKETITDEESQKKTPYKFEFLAVNVSYEPYFSDLATQRDIERKREAYNSLFNTNNLAAQGVIIYDRLKPKTTKKAKITEKDKSFFKKHGDSTSTKESKEKPKSILPVTQCPIMSYIGRIQLGLE